MIMHCPADLPPGSSGLLVRWSGGFAIARPAAGRLVLTSAVLAGELCAVLDMGAAGLIVELPGPSASDSACLEALMCTARRARGWGAWLRVVVPDPGSRRLVRLVALDEVMPVHASVCSAAAAAVAEAAMEAGGR